MRIISDAANQDGKGLPDVQRDLIQSIRDRLKAATNEYVSGSITLDFPFARMFQV